MIIIYFFPNFQNYSLCDLRLLLNKLDQLFLLEVGKIDHSHHSLAVLEVLVYNTASICYFLYVIMIHSL